MDYLYRRKRLQSKGKATGREGFMEASVQRAAMFTTVLVNHFGFGHRVKVGTF